MHEYRTCVIQLSWDQPNSCPESFIVTFNKVSELRTCPQFLMPKFQYMQQQKIVKQGFQFLFLPL